MDGLETSALIRRNGLSRAPIIVISANAFADDRERSVAAACDDYLAKPVHTPQLLEKIKQHLELEWLERHDDAPKAAPSPLLPPSPASLAELQELGALGYVKGILACLDRIERAEPASAAYLAALRTLVKQFRLNDFNRQLKDALQPADPHLEGEIP